MTAIIITGHGQFASGIHSALTLISGTSPDVHAVNFEEGDTPDALGEKLAKILKIYENDSVVIFTDIIGGAPFRQAAQGHLVEPGNAGGTVGERLGRGGLSGRQVARL